jgi:iron-sulfur cluster repair protein YtfE (RIC family)
MDFEVPKSIKLEHEELHEDLEEATMESGLVGDAAKAVQEVLQPHFLKEEEFALPPLGLLSKLSNGQITPEMKDAIAMTDRLRAELRQMLSEHKEIVARLKTLTEAALKENKLDYVQFAEKLALHAQTEEEVLYPAAILVGEYLKMQFENKF